MCSGPQWKREVVPDHKFDFIDTRDFTDHSCWMRTRYLWIYVLVLKSFLVYVSDIFTAITMISTNSWSSWISSSCSQDSANGCVFIPFAIGKWLFVGCIISSFLLLAYEARKAKKIISSRDISYAFTNIMANNYYSLRSYDHFCFFCKINNSTKKKDDFAFFVFFTFKSWKRLLLADGPRQVINALTLYSFYLSGSNNPGPFYDITKYTGGSVITTALVLSTAFTVIIFAGSALLLLAAGICYIPLLCYIQGNLKEYCCHKVDKRIAEIVKRKNKERLAKAAALARKEAAGDFSHLKDKKGKLLHAPLPQPTLPNISLDDLDDSTSVKTKYIAPASYLAKSDYYGGMKDAYTPGAPEYPPSIYTHDYKYPFQGYGQYSHSSTTVVDDSSYYGEKNSSTAYLTQSPVTPMDPISPHEALSNPYPQNYDMYEDAQYYQPSAVGNGQGWQSTEDHDEAYGGTDDYALHGAPRENQPTRQTSYEMRQDDAYAQHRGYSAQQQHSGENYHGPIVR